MEKWKEYSILYAEDESIIRINIAQQLEAFFQNVIVAKNGEEALSLFKQKDPDVVMLDINMPKMDGLDVARYIRMQNQDVPIIILTAYTESTLLLDAIDLSITKYLVKPLSKSKLKEALLGILKKLDKNPICRMKLAENCHWHREEQNLYYHDAKVDLTAREKSLLQLLIQKYQKNVSKEEIIVHVWADKYMEEISLDTIKKLVSNLRKKLPEGCLTSVYGSGYILS